MEVVKIDRGFELNRKRVNSIEVDIWFLVADPRRSCGTNAKVTPIRITIQTLVNISVRSKYPN